MRTLYAVLLSAFFVMPSLAATPDPMQPQSYRQARVRDLVTKVNAAAALVQQRGEAAFAEFRKPGPWFLGKDDFYLFVFDLEGNQVVNAAFPEAEVNRLDWTDKWGKPLFRLATERLAPEQGNRMYWWSHYLWPKPGLTDASWKSTYMVRTRTPAGRVYIVAAGLYDVATEPLWIELLVDEASDLIAAQGDAAYPVIASRASPFMYRDTFVFVFNEQGVELATGAFPELMGKNLLELPDFPRKQLIRDQIAFVKQHGAGWTRGVWPRPGETQAVTEQVYLRGIRRNGTLLVVGSAIYD